MPRGGKRPGAGRPKGSTNKRSRVTAPKALATGMTPLDILLDSARRLHTEGDFVNAAAVAARAAPYVHQKFTAMQEPAARHPEQKTQADLFDPLPPAESDAAKPKANPWDGLLN